jgi:hypothetical protein
MDLRADKMKSGNWVYDASYASVEIIFRYVDGCTSTFAPPLTTLQKSLCNKTFFAPLNRDVLENVKRVWVDTTLYSQLLSGDLLKATWELTAAALDVAAASTYSSNVPFVLSGDSDTNIFSNTKTLARLSLYNRYLVHEAMQVQVAGSQH